MQAQASTRQQHPETRRWMDASRETNLLKRLGFAADDRPTKDEVQKRFRQIAKVLHTDSNSCSPGETLERNRAFTAVKEAYDKVYLTAPEKRVEEPKPASNFQGHTFSSEKRPNRPGDANSSASQSSSANQNGSTASQKTPFKSDEEMQAKNASKLKAMQEELARKQKAMQDEVARKQVAMQEALARKQAAMKDEHLRKQAAIQAENARKEAEMQKEIARKQAEMRDALAGDSGFSRVMEQIRRDYESALNRTYQNERGSTEFTKLKRSAEFDSLSFFGIQQFGDVSILSHLAGALEKDPSLSLLRIRGDVPFELSRDAVAGCSKFGIDVMVHKTNAHEISVVLVARNGWRLALGSPLENDRCSLDVSRNEASTLILSIFERPYVHSASTLREGKLVTYEFRHGDFVPESRRERSLYASNKW